MVKIALKKMQFLTETAFLRCKFGDFWGGRLFRSTLSGGIEKYIEVVSVII